MSESKKRRAGLESVSPVVPVQTTYYVPERDVDKSPILQCINLGISFGGLKAVEDFNLTLGRTEIAGLIGPNGAGKTTIFNLLTKVYQPTHGTILLDGRDTANMTTAQVNRAGIARTFQNIRLFHNQTVADNVLIGLHNEMERAGGLSALRRPASAGDRPCSRDESVPPAAGRTGGRYEPLRDRGAHGEHCQDPRHLPHRHSAH